MLDELPAHTLGYSPWIGKLPAPEVSFSIGYGADSIFLKYYVTEYNSRAVYTRPNEPVHRDSCVEFFISFDDDRGYYNFEFNFLGNALVEFGSGRGDRTLLPPSLIRTIRTQTVITPLQEKQEGLVHWELTIAIPFGHFHYHTITSLNDKVCRVNFHKCGDDMPDPHFLIWNNIDAPVPDFHLPQFFGRLTFESEVIA